SMKRWRSGRGTDARASDRIMIFSENRLPPPDRVRGHAFSGSCSAFIRGGVRPRQRLDRQVGMRPAEIGRWRILADLHDAAPDGTGAGEMRKQGLAVATA